MEQEATKKLVKVVLESIKVHDTVVLEEPEVLETFGA